MFVAKISESGSNKRAVENQVLALWLDYIQDIEGMYIYIYIAHIYHIYIYSTYIAQKGYLVPYMV